jgi:hypothetical protein
MASSKLLSIAVKKGVAKTGKSFLSKFLDLDDRDMWTNNIALFFSPYVFPEYGIWMSELI